MVYKYYKRNKKKRKKYSYNERAAYYGNRYSDFVNQYGTKNGDDFTSYDYDAFELALRNNPRMQYASGFDHFVRYGDTKSFTSSFDKQSKDFNRGVEAAKKALEKAKNIKF